MGWTSQPTNAASYDCRVPFSFFFDVVDKHWKAPSAPVSFHRLCTLARKMRAQTIVVDDALVRPEIIEELDALDAKLGGNGAAEAITISFFRSEFDPDDTNLEAASDLVGQLTLINYQRSGSVGADLSYIYEAIFQSPAMRLSNGEESPLLNNFSAMDSEFEVIARGKKFKVRGVYYCQQNGLTHVCAHAGLRMALNTISPGAPRLSPLAINQQQNLQSASAFEIRHLVDVIDKSGAAKANVIQKKNGLSQVQWLAALNAYIESGFIVLVTFSTATPNVSHVVVAFGLTQNSDEWHPQAIPAYSGPQSASHFVSSSWTDHIMIHDDNFGPYYALNSRALEVDPAMTGDFIVALMPETLLVHPLLAEAIATVWLSASNVSGGTGDWFDYLKRQPREFVLRTLLVQRDRYKEHLTTMRGHDDTQVSAQQVDLVDSLPERFWMVEFSLPPLFTGNHSKLGEVLISCDIFDPKQPLASVLAARLPSLFVMNDASTGAFVNHPLDLLSHSPILRLRDHQHKW